MGGISPPRNQLTTKTRFWVQRAPSQSLPGKLEVRSGNQKKKKKHFTPPPNDHNLRTLFVLCMWGWVTDVITHAKFQQFRLPRGSKFTISHRLGEWLLQQCYALTCYTVINRCCPTREVCLLFHHHNAHRSHQCSAQVTVMCTVILILSDFASFVEGNNPKLMPSIALSSLKVPQKCVALDPVGPRSVVT